MRKPLVLAGALSAAGLIIAGGTAFTAGNTVEDSVAGYGTSTISGATATAVNHTLSTDGSSITSTSITFSASQTGNIVKAGFGADTLSDCAVDEVDGTSATCTWATAVDTATAVAFNVAVS